MWQSVKSSLPLVEKTVSILKSDLDFTYEFYFMSFMSTVKRNRERKNDLQIKLILIFLKYLYLCIVLSKLEERSKCIEKSFSVICMWWKGYIPKLHIISLNDVSQSQ